MTDIEVAQTPKFEKLLYTEMGEKSPYEMRNSDNAWRNDISKSVFVVNIHRQDIPMKLSEIRKDKTIPRGTFINKDTGIKIIFGQNSIDETVSKAIPDNKRNILVEARMCALFQMKEIIENAIFFDSRIYEYDPNLSKNKSPNTLFMHRFHGIINYNDTAYLANLIVEEAYITNKQNELTGTNKRLYSFRDIEIAPIEALRIFSPASDNNSVAADTSIGATISIPQLYEIVKTYDKSCFENPKAVGREERECELSFNAEFDDARSTVLLDNLLSDDKVRQKIERYARSNGVSLEKAAADLIKTAVKTKEERDILLKKLNETNDVFRALPKRISDTYQKKRDELRGKSKDEEHGQDELKQNVDNYAYIIYGITPARVGKTMRSGNLYRRH